MQVDCIASQGGCKGGNAWAVMRAGITRPIVPEAKYVRFLLIMAARAGNICSCATEGINFSSWHLHVQPYADSDYQSGDLPRRCSLTSGLPPPGSVLTTGYELWTGVSKEELMIVVAKVRMQFIIF